MDLLEKCRSNIFKSAVLLFRDGVRNHAPPPSPFPEVSYLKMEDLYPVLKLGSLKCSHGIKFSMFPSKQCSYYRVDEEY